MNHESRFWERIEKDGDHARALDAGLLQTLREEIARSAAERASFLALLAAELRDGRAERRELATRVQGWEPPAAAVPEAPGAESAPSANFASGLRDADFVNTLSRAGFTPTGDEGNRDSWLHNASGESFDSAESAMYFAGLLAKGVPVVVALDSMSGALPQEVPHAEGFQPGRGPTPGGDRPEGP